MKSSEKSSAKSIEVERDFVLLKFNNDSEHADRQERPVSKDNIQLHFSIAGESDLSFNNGSYVMKVPTNTAMLLYNPNQDLPINLNLPPNSRFISLLVDIDKFHAFFSQEAGLIHFLDNENRTKKYYTNKELSPKEILILNELYNINVNSSLELLLTKGKVFELLSVFFSKNENADNCPFLKDENNVRKILQAKQIIIDQMANPPKLEELSKMIELPLKKLKDGFKQIYGTTVYNFHLTYKMEVAKNLIEKNELNVAELSEKLGYSTPSHFIAAFKKQYGTTPKKYSIG